MALLVTLFLVLINIFNAITNNSPKADGLNALQVGIKILKKNILFSQTPRGYPSLKPTQVEVALFDFSLFHWCGTRTTDAQRENSLHCTAENSLPLPNL